MLTRTQSILLLSVLLPAIPAFCQLDTATLSGRVTDSSGALIPNAQIKVVQTETNFESSNTIQCASGLYKVPSLRPGPYRVVVTAPGFKVYIREGITLQVGDDLAADARLEVGAASESVRVTAEAQQLQTETSSEGATPRRR